MTWDLQYKSILKGMTLESNEYTHKIENSFNIAQNYQYKEVQKKNM